jgi:hypothetical protein
VSTRRTIESPRDVENGWFVLTDDDGDEEVVRLDDADVARVPGRRRAADGSHLDHTTIVADGVHRFRVGDDVELASGAALDAGFRASVRGLWLPLFTVATLAVVVAALEISGLPWRTDIARQLLVGIGCALPASLLVRAVWHRLTRSADGRVTQAMAGRLRDDLDSQRAEV